LPVDLEKGFLWYLENGMTVGQKCILWDNVKTFFKNKKPGKYLQAGLICTDPEGKGRVSIIIENAGAFSFASFKEWLKKNRNVLPEDTMNDLTIQ